MEIAKLETWLINLNPWKVLFFLWINRMLLVFVSASSALLGYAASFLITPTYVSRCALLPERPMSSFGFNLDALVNGLPTLPVSERTGALRTEMYPSILKTTPFAMAILKVPVKTVRRKSYSSLRDYLNTESNHGNIFNAILTKSKTEPSVDQPKNVILELSPNDELNVEHIFSSVLISTNQKIGTIGIETKMDDPVVAASVTVATADYLMNYVTQYRTDKARRDADFLKQRVAEARNKRNKIEYALQRLRDTHRSVVVNIAQMEEHRLQSDFLLAQSILNDVTNKLEQAEIKAKEEQPIFKILEPANLPNTPDRPRRLIIAGVFAVMSVFFTIVVLSINFLRIKFK